MHIKHFITRTLRIYRKIREPLACLPLDPPTSDLLSETVYDAVHTPAKHVYSMESVHKVTQQSCEGLSPNPGSSGASMMWEYDTSYIYVPNNLAWLPTLRTQLQPGICIFLVLRFWIK